jgi:hypothetical protein
LRPGTPERKAREIKYMTPNRINKEMKYMPRLINKPITIFSHRYCLEKRPIQTQCQRLHPQNLKISNLN